MSDKREVSAELLIQMKDTNKVLESTLNELKKESSSINNEIKKIALQLNVDVTPYGTCLEKLRAIRNKLDKSKTLTTFQYTVPYMLSEDYTDRFKAEYYQLIIRFFKLNSMLTQLNEGTLDFEPTCPKNVLEKQMDIMQDYMNVLCERSKIENISL